MKWEEAIIDGSSKVQNYLLNAIMVIEKKNSLRIGSDSIVSTIILAV